MGLKGVGKCVCLCVKELCERVAWDRSGVRLRH